MSFNGKEFLCEPITHGRSSNNSSSSFHSYTGQLAVAVQDGNSQWTEGKSSPLLSFSPTPPQNTLCLLFGPSSVRDSASGANGYFRELGVGWTISGVI